MRVVGILITLSLLAIGAFAIGCGDDLVPPPDFATIIDLATPTDLPVFAPTGDLACVDDGGPTAAVDPSTFCDGTPMAGTCVQAFFTKVLECYSPAGCCACRVGNHIDCHWDSGARFHSYGIDGTYEFWQNATLCASATKWTAPPGMIKWTLADGTTLITGAGVRPETETCPDGTQQNVAPWDSCRALIDLFVPYCTVRY